MYPELTEPMVEYTAAVIEAFCAGRGLRGA
jgi:hypothetical protein